MTYSSVIPNRSRRIGAALVEAAFVLPVFFLLIIGIIEIGRGLMVQELLTRAARAGCRQGILPSTTSNTDVQTAVQNALQNNGITGATVNVKVNGTAGNAGTAVHKDEITVEVTAPVAGNSWWPNIFFLPQGGTIQAVFVLQRE